MKKVLFLQSNKDQARTFAKYLRKSNNFELYFDKKSKYNSTDDFDIIIPCGAASTLIYFMDKGSLKIGELDFAENNFITFEKIKTLRMVENIGVPIPRTFKKKSQLDFFPIFYKSLREDTYRERGIAYNKEELNKIKSKTVFYQEFIPSRGTYSVGFLADRGKLITSFAQKEEISVPYHGGSAVVLEKIEDKRLLDYTKKIVEKIDYSGWGLAEYKFCDKRNDYIFMEVNAKFWASIEFTFLNNPLFLKLLFDIELKKRDIKTAIFLDRFILSNPKEAKKCIPYIIKSKWLKTKSIRKALHQKFIERRKVN